MAQAVPVRVRPPAVKTHKAGENRLLENYLPIFIFMIIGLAVGIIAPILGYILSPKRPYPAKLSSYECGFDPFNDSRSPFDVRYYMVALLFIIFDLETAFLVPWAVGFRSISTYGLVAVTIFLVLLTIGFIYEWKKGALEWE